MNKYLKLIEFFPIAIFLYFAKERGWQGGFEYGAIAAIVQFVLLFFLKGTISRLVAGVNLFLILGGIAFYFEISVILQWMADLREALLFVCILVGVLAATFFSKMGAFETISADTAKVRKYSLILIGFICVCVAWSFYFRGNTMMAGTYPFLVLIGLRMFLQRGL